jgi:hypothetical protein
MFSVNYQKRKNQNLFSKFQTNKQISLSNVQNYLPIYDRFFSLNSTNCNSINLNHLWSISDIKDKDKDKDKDNTDNIFTCKLKNISDLDDFTSTQKVFFKMAPLLDPFKYLVGKYNTNDSHLFNLPSWDNSVIVHPKLKDTNNSSYIDGFFCYLTSQVLNNHGFIHGVDYYGSFLAIKNNFKLNVIDDIDYLIKSEFFNKNQNDLFNVEDYSHLITNDDVKILKPLNISNGSHKSILSAKSIDDSIFENIFENNEQTLKVSSDLDLNNNHITLSDIKHMNIELIDIMNSNQFTTFEHKKSETLKSGSSCSSRTSHTNENDIDPNDDIIDVNEVNEDDDNNANDANDDDIIDGNDMMTGSGSGSGSGSNSSDLNDYSDIDEETLWATIPKFPVQVICMENCETTLDSLIINNELSHDEWFSALMQIIMILITYQKLFSFTHNDLHTNNIMYVSTNKKFIYYCYKKKYYKVPTFGKIFKIIDFGRAIYKFNGKVFCSDSFQLAGDASTQYNTEPYFNEKKPRLDPNLSFDLCRLACSIFDYIIDDIDDVKNLSECEPIVKLIVEWCIDDNGINVLYKNNGVERYPDFKLYKMIARCVHNHTPVAQLERAEFSKFAIQKNNLPKGEQILNIDEYPSYIV